MEHVFVERRPAMQVNIGKVSAAVIGICFAVFALQVIWQPLTGFIALDSSVLLSQPWRLVTYLFAHGSASHLLLNSFGLFLFGFILERQVGSRVFALLFFSAGILSAVGQSMLSGGSAVGMSGALFGVMGMLAILKPKMTVYVSYVPLPMILAAGVWAVSEGLLINLPDGIGHSAHFFGLLVGVAAGLWWRLGKRQHAELL